MKYARLSLSAFFLLAAACRSASDQVVAVSVTSAPTQSTNLTSTLAITRGPIIAPTLTATLIPCGPSIVHPVADHPEYSIHYDGCTIRDSAVIETAFNWGIDAVPSNVGLNIVDLYVFDDNIEGVAEVQNASKRTEGFSTSSLEEVKNNWGNGGAESRSDGTIIVYFGEWWKTVTKETRMQTMVHELHHQMQYRVSGVKNFNNLPAPVWWVEGSAQYYSAVIVTQHGLTPTFDRALLECNRTLAELSNWSTLDGNCLYAQAEEAAHLLDQLYGEQKYLELLGSVKQYGFEGAFQRTYGISVENFDQLFQQYRDSKYYTLPSTITTTAIP